MAIAVAGIGKRSLLLATIRLRAADTQFSWGEGHGCLCLIKLYSDWAGFSIDLKYMGGRNPLVTLNAEVKSCLPNLREE
ncbi:hypothetical protein HUN01_32480 [Nostoc edaphicum CCNP1411]|uniref:Uncharacterized protein n=1 Tax=Nostoc edaphicum CCNP1411 TaxID=1472755 RepID=A0A7D7LJ57_9NOSO|nr:hypothetical protein [Nostoc edaphicum]QMS92091.1 hypothetical protein HUN01_32480 [Nostoc edaphicum CCNP1411]